MQTQAEYSSSLSHTHALLTLLQLHQYQELCYQLYLLALYTSTRKTTPDGTATWVYDTADNGIGLLASESHDTEAISRVYTYDSLSRPHSCPVPPSCAKKA